MNERLERNLLTMERTTTPVSLKVQRVIDTILRGADLFDDARIRQLTLTRATPVGDWVIVGALAFELWDGEAQPLYALPEEPRHHAHGTLTTGSKEHRARPKP